MGQLVGQSDVPEAKQIFPLINFRSRGETSAGFSSSELSQAGVAKEEREKREGEGEKER